MKFSLKACLGCFGLAFFGAAIGMFALSFLDQVTASVLGGNKGSWGTGFDVFKSDLDASNKLGTIFAFAFICLGALAALCALVLALGGNKKKGNKNVKLISACCLFVVCGVVPAVLLFLTKQTTGIGIDAKTIVGSTETKLGIGAILAAVFSLLGGCSLSLSVASK